MIRTIMSVLKEAGGVNSIGVGVGEDAGGKQGKAGTQVPGSGGHGSAVIATIKFSLSDVATHLFVHLQLSPF